MQCPAVAKATTGDPSLACEPHHQDACSLTHAVFRLSCRSTGVLPRLRRLWSFQIQIALKSSGNDGISLQESWQQLRLQLEVSFIHAKPHAAATRTNSAIPCSLERDRTKSPAPSLPSHLLLGPRARFCRCKGWYSGTAQPLGCLLHFLSQKLSAGKKQCIQPELSCPAGTRICSMFDWSRYSRPPASTPSSDREL